MQSSEEYFVAAGLITRGTTNMLLLYLQTQERSSWQNSVFIVEKPCQVIPYGIVLAVER
jgi:hypothetical protein